MDMNEKRIETQTFVMGKIIRKYSLPLSEVEELNNIYEKTNVPILFNTSFNLAGDPLVETKQDAINTLNNSDINYLYMP